MMMKIYFLSPVQAQSSTSKQACSYTIISSWLAPSPLSCKGSWMKKFERERAKRANELECHFAYFILNCARILSVELKIQKIYKLLIFHNLSNERQEGKFYQRESIRKFQNFVLFADSGLRWNVQYDGRFLSCNQFPAYSNLIKIWYIFRPLFLGAGEADRFHLTESPDFINFNLLQKCNFVRRIQLKFQIVQRMESRAWLKKRSRCQ